MAPNNYKRTAADMLSTSTNNYKGKLIVSPNDTAEPPTKKSRQQKYSSKPKKSKIKKMGFESDHGMEKQEKEHTQNRGGPRVKSSSDNTVIHFDPAQEIIEIRESPNWLYHDVKSDQLDEKKIANWVKIGQEKLTIDDETQCCDPTILKQILQCKTFLKNVNPADVQSAGLRSHPFEAIGKSVFMNQSAVKMANLDCAFNYMFTKPIDMEGNSLVGDNEPLYFADVCAGPGGFSEYILFRKKCQAKGFGFTLKAKNDFKLNNFIAGPPEAFETHYGALDNGNIYAPKNIVSFTNHIMQSTERLGVHFMMADGELGVAGQENLQEILSKQLYLCQCLMALCIVRRDGHFIMKLFDTYTPFSIGLIYLMSKSFAQISILKPNSSRPANSERYLVCKWRLPNVEAIRDYLSNICRFMWKHRQSKAEYDVQQLVPMDLMKEDKKFFKYICESNNTIGRKQIVSLSKFIAYCQDSTLRDHRQTSIHEKCLRTWYLPQMPNRQTPKESPVQTFTDLMGDSHKEFLSLKDNRLIRRQNIANFFANIDAWHFVPIEVTKNIGNSIRTFFLRGNDDVYQYSDKKTWDLVEGIHLPLPRNTLLYGEIVAELSGEGELQHSVSALHVIDGIYLGGEDIRSRPLRTRLQLCQKFVKSINRPCKAMPNGKILAPIRCKPLIPLNNLHRFFNELQSYQLKDGRIRPGMTTSTLEYEPHRFFVPRGIMLFNEIKPSLRKCFTKKRELYVDLAQKNKRFFAEDLDDPDVLFASFESTFAHRQLWKWDRVAQMDPTVDEKERLQNLVYRADLERHIYRH